MSIVPVRSQTYPQASPIASVIVPWWDHTDLLQLWQGNLEHLQNAEIIFIDNGSASAAQAELQEFCQRHELRLIRNETN